MTIVTFVPRRKLSYAIVNEMIATFGRIVSKGERGRQAVLLDSAPVIRAPAR